MPGLTFNYGGDRFGLELRTSINDLNRDPANAVDCNNFMLRPQGGMISRKGSTIKADRIGGFGLFNYVYENASGALTKELLTVDENLHRIDEGKITITYAGSNSNTYVTVYSDGSTRYLDLYDNGTRVLNKDLGIGYNETSTITMAALKTSIDGISNFTATITGTTTIPAAFIENTKPTPFNAGTAAQDIKFWYPTQIDTPLTDPFSDFTANRDNADFENADFVNHKNCLYLTFPGASLKLYKYDGQSVYLAGLPAPEAIDSLTRSTSGNITGSTQWKYSYIYTDIVGNVVESTVSTASTAITLASENVALTLPSIIRSTGYNTNCAMVVANQNVAPSSGTVTLNVDDGVGGAHTLTAGDTAYLLNRSTGEYTTYSVSSATSNTVVLTSSETIQVSNNDVISANLRIALYRNQAGGSSFYLVAELPNNSFLDITSYTDSTADVSANTLYVAESETAGPPPTCSYVQNYGDNLIVAEGNTIYYSDEVGPNPTVTNSSENFPSTGATQQTIYSSSGGKIKGMSNTSKNTESLNSSVFLVFGDEFIKGMTGTLSVSSGFSVFDVSNHLGCVSKSSIVHIDNSLIFLSKTGINVLTNGILESSSLSFDIDPYFKLESTEPEYDLQLSRAVGVNWVSKDLYLLFIPREETSVNKYANRHSEILVYDYVKRRWMKWDSLNMEGGAVFSDDKLWFSDRALIRDRKLWKMNDSSWKLDYYDHEASIDCSYRTGFDRFGVEGYKKARSIKPYTILTEPFDHLSSFTLTCKTYIDYMDWWQHTSVDISRGSVNRQWGFPWGKAFGGPLEVAPKTKLRSGKIRSMQVLFESTVSGAPIILTGWDIFCSFPFRGQEPKE